VGLLFSGSGTFRLDIHPASSFSSGRVPLGAMRAALLLALALVGLAAPARAEHALHQRACGSPARDGYGAVDAACLNESPAAEWYWAYLDSGRDARDLDVHVEMGADYFGFAVKWGIDTHFDGWEACAEACKAYRPTRGAAGFQGLPCNSFAYCAAALCYSPGEPLGAHKQGNCWLKFTEGPGSPEVSQRGNLPQAYREAHADAPRTVHWVAGVLLPRDVEMREGTWGPRWAS